MPDRLNQAKFSWLERGKRTLATIQRRRAVRPCGRGCVPPLIPPGCACGSGRARTRPARRTDSRSCNPRPRFANKPRRLEDGPFGRSGRAAPTGGLDGPHRPVDAQLADRLGAHRALGRPPAGAGCRRQRMKDAAPAPSQKPASYRRLEMAFRFTTALTAPSRRQRAAGTARRLLRPSGCR